MSGTQLLGIAYVVLALFGGVVAFKLREDYQMDRVVAERGGPVEYKFLVLLNQRIERAQTFIGLCVLVLALGIVAILVVAHLDLYLLGLGLIGPIVLDGLIVRSLRQNRFIRR